MKEEITKARKQNMKIYAIYRAISLDLIFYYAIELLFLTQVKHISSADVVLSSGFYAIFMMLFQIPASIIVDKIGTRKCTILGNLFNSAFVILIMCCNDLETLIFAQLISAICFSLKNISDKALIQYSIPESKKQGEIFSKIEGKGYRNYFLINAFASICSGSLFVIHPYIPMILSLIGTILATIISLGFQEIEKQPNVQKEKYVQNLIQGAKFIIKSQRLRSLFLYAGISWGIFCLMGTFRTSLLIDIGIPEQIITVIAAIVGIAASIGSKWQLIFHNYFRNRSLTTIFWMITIAILIAGNIGLANITLKASLIIITSCFIVIDFSKGMSEILTTRYLSNFSNEKILTQIYAVDSISRNLFRAGISFLGSYLLQITDTANSIILLGIILLITALGLTSYMKMRVGKKPEEYDENDIFQEKTLV